MGGEMQPQGHVQVASSLIDHGCNPQSALDAPHYRVLGGLRVLVEEATPPTVIERLRARGHEVEVSRSAGPFGRGQIICRLESGAYAAGTAPRADGGLAAF